MSAAPSIKDALKFEIEVVNGPHTGLRLEVAKGNVTIGRGPENDIVLSSDPRVSRQHAEIKQRDGEFLVVNLSAKNFILVDGQVVQSEVLKRGAIIQIGETEIRFSSEALPAISSSTSALNSQGSAAAPSALTSPSMQAFSPAASAPAFVPKPQSQPMTSIPQAGMPSSAPPIMPQTQSNTDYFGGGLHHSPRGPSAGSGVGSESLLQNPKLRFYGIIAVLALGAWFIFSPSKNRGGKDPNAIRTSVVSQQDIVEAEKRSQELLSLKKDKYDTVQYRRAQENFIRGFRDFQQGQYARAREAFQVVLNLDPDNELAKRYYHLSKIKFDELVKFNMIQGNRYREKKNWRMCQSNYSNVMTMLQNRKDDPTFKEAKQFFDECSLNVETGRF